MVAFVAVNKTISSCKANDYRTACPISVSYICLERIFMNHQCLHAMYGRFLASEQQGLINIRLCSTNLLMFQNKTTRRMDEGKGVKAWSIDIREDIHLVAHFLPDPKEPPSSVNGSPRNLMRQSHGSRRCTVPVGNQESQSEETAIGVPWGFVH